jgi:hypothetical protein
MLVEDAHDKNWELGERKTLIGHMWAPALLMAWSIGSSQVEDRGIWDERLLKWQHHASYMPMFVADLQLSRDYGEFLLGLGGPFVALLVGLASGHGQSCHDFLRVLLDTQEQVAGSWLSLHPAIWSCHVSARLKMAPEFNRAREGINAAGGVARSDLLRPPSWVSVSEAGPEEQYSWTDRVECPPMNVFLSDLRSIPWTESATRTTVLLRALDDEEYTYSWSESLLRVLWEPAG